MVRFFVEQGVSVDRLDLAGWSVLGVAIDAQHLPVTQFLLSRGARWWQRLQNDSMAIHVASRTGKLSFVDELLKRGADPNVVDMKGRTALHLAASADVATALLNSGARQARTLSGRFPLHSAALRGHADVVGVILTRRLTNVED